MLTSYYDIDLLSLEGFNQPLDWSVEPSVSEPDGIIFYDIMLAGRDAACKLQFARYRREETFQHVFDVPEIVHPTGIFHRDESSLKNAIIDYVSFGWNPRSTLVRALNAAGLYLRSLEAEARLAERNQRVAPDGLLVIHNTSNGSLKSITDNDGLRLSFASDRVSIWSRPPSFGGIAKTRFKGNVSFLLDVSGLRINSASGHAVVIGEDIPLSRFRRVFDLDARTG